MCVPSSLTHDEERSFRFTILRFRGPVSSGLAVTISRTYNQKNSVEISPYPSCGNGTHEVECRHTMNTKEAIIHMVQICIEKPTVFHISTRDRHIPLQEKKPLWLLTHSVVCPPLSWSAENSILVCQKWQINHNPLQFFKRNAARTKIKKTTNLEHTGSDDSS